MPSAPASIHAPPTVERLALAAVPMLLGAAPLLHVEGWDPIDLQRVLQVLGLSLAGFAWGVSVGRSGLSLSPKANLALALWLVLAVASAAAAAHALAALQDLALLVGCLVLMDLARRSDVRSSAEWIARGAVLGAGFYAGIVMLVFAGAVVGGDSLFIGQIILGFDNYRFLNHSQTVMLPILAIAAAADPQSGWRRSASVVLVLQIALLVLARGRATMLGVTMATLLGLWLVAAPTRRRFVRAMAAGAIAGTLVYWVILQGLPHVLGLPWLEQADPAGDLSSGQERLFLWTHALQAIQQSPWLGIGPMHFAALHLDPGAHPHNVYLQWLAEYGVLAGSLMVVALLAAVYNGARRLGTEAEPTIFAQGVWVACMAAVIDGLLSGNFVMPLSQCWIAFAFGLLLHRNSPPRAATGRRALVVIALVFVLGLAFKVAADARKDPPRAGEAVQPTAPGKSLDPRFWLHGRI